MWVGGGNFVDYYVDVVVFGVVWNECNDLCIEFVGGGFGSVGIVGVEGVVLVDYGYVFELDGGGVLYYFCDFVGVVGVCVE